MQQSTYPYNIVFHFRQIQHQLIFPPFKSPQRVIATSVWYAWFTLISIFVLNAHLTSDIWNQSSDRTPDIHRLLAFQISTAGSTKPRKIFPRGAYIPIVSIIAGEMSLILKLPDSYGEGSGGHTALDKGGPDNTDRICYVIILHTCLPIYYIWTVGIELSEGRHKHWRLSHDINITFIGSSILTYRYFIL